VIALTIYTRPGCHLCDEMKATINRVSRSWRLPLVIKEIDISSDPELETRYGQEIPVLLIEGRKAAKYRVTEEELARILKSQLSRGS
jgi:hypothetical protein